MTTSASDISTNYSTSAYIVKHKFIYLLRIILILELLMPTQKRQRYLTLQEVVDAVLESDEESNTVIIIPPEATMEI